MERDEGENGGCESHRLSPEFQLVQRFLGSFCCHCCEQLQIIEGFSGLYLDTVKHYSIGERDRGERGVMIKSE